MTTKASIRDNLNSMHMSDIYSLMLFITYKLQDVPEYAVLSELCYLLDGTSLTRLLTYFAGRTIKVPTAEEFAIMSNALLLYQAVNIDGKSLVEAQKTLTDLTVKQKEEVTNLYLKILPIMRNYNIDRSELKKNV